MGINCAGCLQILFYKWWNRPQKTLVAVTYTWLGFFLVKHACHQFTLLLPSRGHVLWGSSVSGHREWGISVSRNTKKIESKQCKPTCYQVWAPTSKLSFPTYRPLFSVTLRKKKKKCEFWFACFSYLWLFSCTSDISHELRELMCPRASTPKTTAWGKMDVQ